MTFLKHYSRLSKIKTQRAITLIELLIIIAILGVISSISNSWYQGYVETARITNAIAQISAMSLIINDYILENGEPPSSLAQINNNNLIDPWGRPYQYLKIDIQDTGSYGAAGGTSFSNSGSGGGNYYEESEDGDGDEGEDESEDESEDYEDDSPGNSAIAKARKGHGRVPLNSDYDLYSKGNDGNSKAPLSAAVSQDDVLRANNGGFIGLASTF